jgi:ligand-binding sensor domain-containing protein/anti-sigma regulatory factor (Ser/Thr protein kinase)
MTSAFIKILFFCSIIFFSQKSMAQQPAYTYYSIREGLASNDIYGCLVDKKGFLWLATENGVSKFDGHSFRNYSVAQGLPDNDVLSIEMDSAGVIWVLPFQKTAAYYDDKNDKFVNSSSDAELNKIKFGNVNYINPLVNGGIGFCNSIGQIYTYKNGKSLLLSDGNLPTTFSRVIELSNDKFCIVSNKSISTLENGKINIQFQFSQKIRFHTFVNNNLYFTDSVGISKVKINKDGTIGSVVQTKLPFSIRGLNFTGKQIAIASQSGNMYFADTATLEIKQQSFTFNSFPRHVYEDNFGNTWICTKENGLIRYQQKGILSLDNERFQGNFNAISFLNNKIIAGTNNGETIVYDGPYTQTITNLKNDKSFTTWVTKIIAVKDAVLVGSEGGFFKIKNNNEKTELFGKPYNHIANKDFDVVNDSILISGNSSNVYRVNYKTEKIINTLIIRVTALQYLSDTTIYVGSNTGLYIWKNLKDKIYVGDENPILKTRVSALAYNKLNKILWIGLATDTIVGMQNGNIIVKIPFGNKLAGNICKSIYSTKSGVLWVGTNAALGRIDYTQTNKGIDYFISPFTTADGIAGKQINDIQERNDTIYVATSNGISMIPSKLKIDVTNTPIFITGIKINNTDTTIQKKYVLNSDNNNITIFFSAPDLGSTAERSYQYKIDNGSWKQTSAGRLELYQLSPGNYDIVICAINRDGNASTIVENITIKIKTPLIKSFWFWGALALLAAWLVFYFTQRRNKFKREEAVQKLLTEKKLSDLELKALKAQINPHFVFNCLNSIKYLNHQKRFVETDLYLDKFSFLLRKTLDYSGLQKITLEEELDYSKNYLELEKLRLGDKLNYEITTGINVDKETTLVPPMLLQPYLENAIKHGIRHLPNEMGMVTIHTYCEANKIICFITDNGVGIDNANLINEKDENKPASHGTTLQQRRVDLYNVEVSTTHGENGVGTIVKLIL